MNRLGRRRAICWFAAFVLSVVLLISVSNSWAESLNAATLSDTALSRAADIMSKLSAGNIRGAIAQIHEPPSWDKPHAEEDRRQITHNLELLLNELGRISSPRRVDNVSFYELQIAGGDVPYWQSLPNFGMDSTVTYLVNFAKAGPGVVAIVFTRASGSWELRSVSLGIERARPHSRETMMRIGRAFLLRIDPSMPKDKIGESLDATFGPGQP